MHLLKGCHMYEQQYKWSRVQFDTELYSMSYTSVKCRSGFRQCKYVREFTSKM